MPAALWACFRCTTGCPIPTLPHPPLCTEQVTTSALSLATEAARLILKIDDVVPTR